MSQSVARNNTPALGFLGRLRSELAPCAPYVFAIFAALLVWHIGVQILYAAIDGPGVSTGKRAEKFAIRLIIRLILFFYFLSIAKLILIVIKRRDSLKNALFRILPPADPVFWLKRLVIFALAAISFIWLQTNFMSVKTAIPVIAPFYLDEAARDWDRILFFGRDPYTVFSAILNSPRIMGFIDTLYTLWAVLIAGVWIFCFVSESMPRVRRFQYIFAMLLIWFIAGNVMATLLSSAGPCYYDTFTGDITAYAPLMERLGALNEISPLGAYEYHDVLLDMYNDPNTRYGGISAMPSLHVGTSLIMLMMFWKQPLLRVLMIAFNIIIYIGSIVLAWHYAVDGLIAVPPALFCWWLGGRIARRLEARNAPPATV